MTSPIYTIGHSTHSIGRLIELLKMHQITALCDVRSCPYSRMNPQFNREPLRDSLRDNIKYVFLGKELGARSEDKNCYRHGQVQYDLLAETRLFKQGMERIREGACSYRIALMCAEKEPLECHRTILIGRRLFEEGTPLKHILADGQVEDHPHAVERLIGMLRIPKADMFRENDTVVREAYDIQANEIAYREQSPDAAQAPHPDAHGAAE
jgi:uncharacterized protein (DUF488 family)